MNVGRYLSGEWNSPTPVKTRGADSPSTKAARQNKRVVKVTNEMVNRFLCWKLPADFSPDCGISFDRVSNKGTPYESVREPTGTNLLSADQARAMLEYVIGRASTATPAATLTDELLGEIFRSVWGLMHSDMPPKYAKFARLVEAECRASSGEGAK